MHQVAEDLDTNKKKTHGANLNTSKKEFKSTLVIDDILFFNKKQKKKTISQTGSAFDRQKSIMNIDNFKAFSTAPQICMQR